MKIATYNVNSIRIRLDAIISWLDKHKPDVLCIQETKCQDEVFPLLVLQSTGYQVHYRGMKSYNGVAILTREKPEAVFYGFDDNLPEIDDARMGMPNLAIGFAPGHRHAVADKAVELAVLLRQRPREVDLGELLERIIPRRLRQFAVQSGDRLTQVSLQYPVALAVAMARTR